MSSCTTPLSGKKPKKSVANPEAIASELCAFYNEILLARIPRSHVAFSQLPGYDDLTPTYRKWFLQAAETCIACGADPRAYVEAQFAAFAKIKQHGKRPRLLLPMPHQIFGMGAQLRYLEYQVALQAAEDLDARHVPSQHKPHYREDRKLQGMSKRTGLPEIDVLMLHPAEFTKAFLKHRGVWAHVKARYDEQMDN
jgi:hypothetical protein